MPPNRLLELLRLEGLPSGERLREVYRALCMAEHPDSGRGSEEGFKRLQEEYREARAALQGSSPRGRRPAPGAPASRPEDPRRTILETLYLYAVRFFGNESVRLMASLRAAAAAHDPVLAALLAVYEREFLSCFHSWASDATVYYTHNLLIAAVKQLAYHFTFGLPHQRRLFLSLLRDLKERARKLSPARRKVLEGLADWLSMEEGKGRMPLASM